MALRQAPPQEARHQAEAQPGPARRGPSRPSPAARPPGPGGRHAAPARPGGRGVPRLTGVLVAGAHGGAGASTLAALLRAEAAGRVPVRDLQFAFPDGDPARIAAAGLLPGQVAGPLVIAARGTAEGARRAVIAVTALACLGIRPAALAVVGDGVGPLPRAAAQRLDLIGDRAGPVVHVPFAASLRAAAAPGSARLTGPLRRAVAELAELAAPPQQEGRR
jgi:hypothetical protein